MIFKEAVLQVPSGIAQMGLDRAFRSSLTHDNRRRIQFKSFVV